MENQKVLDLIKRQFDQLSRNGNLAAQDLHLLNIHREVFGGSSLVDKTVPTPKLALAKDMHDGERSEKFIDLIVNSVKLDRCRNIVLGLTEAQEMKAYGFLPGCGGHGFHARSHLYAGGDHFKVWNKIQEFHAGIFHRLLSGLDEVEDEETGATFLDNSLVLWLGDTGVVERRSHFASTHMCNDLPVAMFGGSGGAIKTGYYLDFSRGVRKTYPNDPTSVWPPHCRKGFEYCELGFPYAQLGRPYNELLVTALRSMNVTPEEYERYNSPGETGFGNYDENHRNQYDLTDRRAPLPIIGT